MLRRARGVVFWPGVASDIKQLADSCETCQEMKPRNTQEAYGDGPGQNIALDLFEITGEHYLLVVEYCSNVIEVDLLTTLKSARAILVSRSMFAYMTYQE